MRSLKVGFSLLLICLLAAGQTALDNATILKLVKAGIGEDTIVGMVNQQPGTYALSADDLIALKNAGVSDKVIAAMIVRNGAGTAPSAPGVAASSVLSNQPAAPPSPNTNQPAHPSDGITRVYISDSQSWEMRGGWSAGGNNQSWGGGGYQAGGARPQTAEIIKTFNQRCSGLTITNNPAKADFAVILDHEGGKGYARKRNKIVVFNREGDDIFSDSTRAVGSSVKDACQAILNHAGLRQSSAVVDRPPAGAMANASGSPPVTSPPFVQAAKTPAPSQLASATPASLPRQTPPPNAAPVSYSLPAQRAVTAFVAQPTPVAPAAAPQAEAEEKPKLTITSNPSGAAVEINGIAVGSTPVTVALARGASFKLTVKMDGYLPWEVQSVAVDGQHTMNAALSKVVVFE